MGMNCALDGPAGAGKSTVARELAKKLGYIYVDTGALYRAIGLYATRCGAETTNAAQVVPLLNCIHLELKFENDAQAVYLNGENVSTAIRVPEMSMAASNVSAIPKVREFLLDLQRNIAANNNIIMDGRDIGTVILPDAQVKIFLTASVEERAHRRYKELMAKGHDVNYDEILKDIAQRDYNDSHRATAPLKKADDAIEVDSSNMTAEEVIDTIADIITRKKALMDTPVPLEKPKLTIGLCLYTLVRWLVKLVFSVMFNVKVEGRENIPHGGGHIIASNHISWADPILIAMQITSPNAYISKMELFKNKLVALILTCVQAFPVTRGSGDTGFVEKSVKFLKKRNNLVIFPEGTRSKTGEIGRAKTGISHIEYESYAPVVPVSVKCDGKLRFRAKVTVTFGSVIPAADLFAHNSSAAEMHRIRDIIMNRIKELYER